MVLDEPTGTATGTPRNRAMKDHRTPLQIGAVRVLSGRHAGNIGYYDDDEGNHAVVYFGEPIYAGYVLIERDYLVNVTSLEHERWKREHPEFCRQMGIE
jgi:hypothetical protein